MRANDALGCLGATRTIWIDDIFSEGPDDLADLLFNSREVALECGVEAIKPYLESIEYYGEEAARAKLIDYLGGLGPDERARIRQSFFSKETTMESFPTEEMSSDAITKVCDHLGIALKDRWNFDQAFDGLPRLCADGDSDVSYVVDLNEAGGSPTRGLEILKLLWDGRSKGVAFIFTHEADADSEAAKESELRKKLLEENPTQLGIPVCVISKERVLSAKDNDELDEALKISIKRAALRRSLSEVVDRAANTINGAFNHAAGSLLNIVPEHLEAYVFERGYKEGVSELHVVERILTSHISKELRMFFGTDAAAMNSVRRLRSLRSIELNMDEAEPDPSLASFRLAEVWETPELINNALTPIACGDVFEADPHELSMRVLKKKFIVLAQPCDIALRPIGKTRDLEEAFFVPLVPAADGDEADIKRPMLPCKVNDQYMACDFRNATQVRLSILDLASFRADGRVRLDDGHVADDNLLAALRRVYSERTAPYTKALAEGSAEIANGIHATYQLTFDNKAAFSHIYRPHVREQSGVNRDAGVPALPKRITWGLRRCGRVRVPYSVALLNQYLEVMRRQAFDLDYIAPGFDKKPKAKKG